MVVEPVPEFDAVLRVTDAGVSPALGPFLQLMKNLEALGWRRGVDVAAFGYA